VLISGEKIWGCEMHGDNPVTSAAAFPDDGWRKPGFCGPNGGNCVEVHLGVRGVVGVRDSKAGAGRVLAFAGDQWRMLLAAATSTRLRRR
jgi:hypothetical protein